MKAIVLGVALSVLLFSNSFAELTGGLDYKLGIHHHNSAETTVTIFIVQTSPFGAETRISKGPWTINANAPKEGPGPGNLYLNLGRIEYGVPLLDPRSYSTVIQIGITDSVVGNTECFFEFKINVRNQPGGPLATVAKAEANGLDSSVFESLNNTDQRCQVFPSTPGGPSMYIFSCKTPWRCDIEP